MRGKTCLVTGANAGIGREIVAGLAAQGARVLMVCRHRGRAEEAIDRVRRSVPAADLELVLADLSRLRSIRALAEDVERRTDRLDVLVSNAGAFNARRRETEDGFEATFAVNHLAPFALVGGLLDLLRASAPSRVVVVASAAHRRGEIDFDDLQGRRRYRGWWAYAQSKLANVLFAAELARRLPAAEVTANSLHPGVVATKLLLRGIVPGWMARPWTITPEEGSRTPLYVATAPGLEGISGQYFDDCRPSDPSAEARDGAVAARLWAVSEELTRVATYQRGSLEQGHR
jgi:NAD(P)-dependent dehydrogenase (short-subunit alcohol dehydrogenase family)